jgi:magnesium-transporting ATPase (P-type)
MSKVHTTIADYMKIERRSYNMIVACGIDFFRNFALNNSVIPVEKKGDFKVASDRIMYKGASPDEVALVRQASIMGIRLAYRENHELRIEVAISLERFIVIFI